MSAHYTLHKWLVGRLDGWMVVKFLPLDPSANKATPPPSSAHDHFHGLAIWAAAAANTLAYARSACLENERVEAAGHVCAAIGRTHACVAEQFGRDIDGADHEIITTFRK